MSETTALRSPGESDDGRSTAGDTGPAEPLLRQIPRTLSHKVEVIADDSNTWAGNGLSFGTKAEAEGYATDLEWRWTSVREWRVVDCDEAPSHSFIDGKARKL